PALPEPAPVAAAWEASGDAAAERAIASARALANAGARAEAAQSVGANVRANDTSEDPPNGGICNSETSIAALGSHVVAAWNDGLNVGGGGFVSPGITGYGISMDGGATFVDGDSPPVTSGSALHE